MTHFDREVASPGASIFKQLFVWALTWTLIIGALATLVFGVLGSMHFDPDAGTSKPAPSKADVAKLTVSKLAFEAFPQWSRAHQGCPHSINELTDYMDSPRSLDPWGVRYRIFCTAGRLIVESSGEDRIPNTADDLWSNR